MILENKIKERDYLKLTNTIPNKNSIESDLIFYIPKSLKEVKNNLKIIDSAIEIVPYIDLKIKNGSEMYRLSNSFIKDLDKGKKSFGFYSDCEVTSDLQMFGLASCLSYLKNNVPLLIIVNDLKKDVWDRYRGQFKEGMLGVWKTAEWGNLCIVDYKEIARSVENLKNSQVDFRFIDNEFTALFWAMPKEEQILELKGFYFDILRSLSSVTIIAKPGITKFSKIKKVERSYLAYGIPLKGILKDGEFNE